MEIVALHVEYKVVFSYERDGTTFEETIFGLDDMAALNREKGEQDHMAQVLLLVRQTIMHITV